MIGPHEILFRYSVPLTSVNKLMLLLQLT